jgi:hypothetical protein
MTRHWRLTNEPAAGRNVIQAIYHGAHKRGAHHAIGIIPVAVIISAFIRIQIAQQIVGCHRMPNHDVKIVGYVQGSR